MSEWKPIETAPKDGSLFLAFIIGRDRMIGEFFLASWDEHFASFVEEENGDLLLYLTHWQSLPEPPK